MKTATEILREHGLNPPSDAPGRYYTICPKCSAARSKAHQKNKVLGITIDSEGVSWGCNHCGWTGGGYYNGKANGHAGDAAGIVATYDYTDENGELLFQVVRKEGKKFVQRRPNGKGGWIWNTKGVQKTIYRLPEIDEAIAGGHTVLVVEGEKDADSAWKLGLPATCNSGGAGDWHSAYSEPLRGADVVLVPDNDDAGWNHINKVGAELTDIAARVRVLVLPGLPPRGDLSDRNGGLGASKTQPASASLIVNQSWGKTSTPRRRCGLPRP